MCKSLLSSRISIPSRIRLKILRSPGLKQNLMLQANAIAITLYRDNRRL